MAVMDLEKILQDLNRRFAAPLPEFYSRRIIFWKDGEREFEDQLEDIVLNNAKLAILTGSNTFEIKKLLTTDDTESNFLVYDPLNFEKDDDNWLINLQLYSETFRADLISIWMDEMGLADTAVIRRQVKNYRKFFNAKARREAVAKWQQNIATAAQMHLAVMAAIVGCSETQPNTIIRGVLCGGLETASNPIYQKLVHYGADQAFWSMVAQGTGYHSEDRPDLGRLAVYLFLTAVSRTLHPDHLAGLEKYMSIAHQAYCFDLIAEWMQSTDLHSLYETTRYVENQTRLFARLDYLEISDLLSTECLPCANEVILIKLMKDVSNQIIQVDVIRSVVEKRRTMLWYDDFACYFEGLLQIADMQQFYLDHAAGFHFTDPQQIWEAYTDHYYMMDGYYRRFHLCFQRCLKHSHPLLDDLFKQAAEQAERLYTNWFLNQLSANWTTACESELTSTGRIGRLPQQKDFYQNKVKNSDSRVFVIISDALRYEVAASLSEQLQRETQSKVSLHSMQAVFPTITKFGMAALLPHQQLTITQKNNGVIGILADGLSTDAGYRDKILKQANPKSVALKYKDIIAMRSSDRRSLVKGMEVVYLYHDRIDEASHTSDTAVFPACDEAIDEIKNLVRIIVNEFSGIKIYITADHGFLYTYSPLKEEDKVNHDIVSDRILEYGRRYAITGNQEQSDFLFPVCLMDRQAEYKAFAPRENIRIKMSGSGMNYVHGGASLQEMVVPLIEYHYLRSSSKTYQQNRDRFDTKPVALNLLSVSRKISNLIFSLNFYQTEAVGSNREAATYLLYFVDSKGRQISDIVKIIADKTGENGQERTFRRSFNLKSQQYNNLESYDLIIADESGLQAPKKESFQIDIAFALDDFDFFG